MLALLLILMGVGCSTKGETAPMSNHAPVASLSDLPVLSLDGVPINLLDTLGEKACVFVFVRSDCPISNRYAPEMKRLHAKFADLGIEFLLVYPDPEATQKSIESHLKEYGHTIQAIRDPKHALVRWAKASITPEVAVVLTDGELIYRGRIDDQWVDFGKGRPEPTQRDLEDLLMRITEGYELSFSETPAVGCYLSDIE